MRRIRNMRNVQQIKKPLMTAIAWARKPAPPETAVTGIFFGD